MQDDQTPQAHPDIVFPLSVPPLNAYWEHNQTSFGWRRDGGRRLHAGVDLVAHANTPVLAMADGVVLRTAPFYEGTGAIEVQHPTLGIVRYGEVSMNFVVVTTQHVRKGQTLGFVGRRTGATRYMLHLELYSDPTRTDTTDKDRLTQSSQAGGSYQRRDDLQDPTALLRRAPIKSIEHITLNRTPSDTNLETVKLKNLLKRAKLVQFHTETGNK